MTETTKKCSRCHTDQPLSQFYDTITTNDGKTYVCKTCSRKSALEARKKKVKEKHDAERKDDEVHAETDTHSSDGVCPRSSVDIDN